MDVILFRHDLIKNIRSCVPPSERLTANGHSAALIFDPSIE